MPTGNAQRQENQGELSDGQKAAHESLKLHAYYKGKMGAMLKCPVRGYEDFSIWYTPWVAAPCLAIKDNPDEVYNLTNKGNTIAVISDGSRVLGLGNIGPLAGLPVMEGKCLLFKYLGGVDAVPIMLDVDKPDDFVETVLRLQPGFGGINLEDISQPRCFKILERLQKEAHIPVWHDDQQGTATVTLAALINALKVVGKKKEDIRIAFIGAGAAGIACSRLIFSWGVDPAQAIMVDERGILGKHRDDIEPNSPAYHLSHITNLEGLKGSIPDALKSADVAIAYSIPGPGVIKPEWVKNMAIDPIIFACANPVPEIWPWEAKAAGAAVVGTGRSDFPNQVNNSLCFPGVFRGVLDVRASKITDEMCFAAAIALSDAIGDELNENQILPKMMDRIIYPLQAAAVGIMAQQQGLARLTMSYEELLNKADERIINAQFTADTLMREGIIPPIPED
jgi:malate dehydrogenase (oxaloacetate-decarboxylating)